MKTLIVCLSDFANVAFKIYSSVREFSDVNVRLFTYQKSSKKFKQDYRYDLAGKEDFDEALKIAKKADVLHFIDRVHPLFDKRAGWDFARLKKPMILSLNHSQWYLRSPQQNERLLSEVQEKHDRILFTTLTSSMPLGAIPTIDSPQPIDVRKFCVKGAFSKEGLLVGHMPCNANYKKKGTDIIKKVLSEVKGVELKIHTHLPSKKAAIIKREFDVFIDQLVLGAYGYNALEAACAGVPTICSLLEDEPPLINCRSDGKDLPEILSRLKDVGYRKSLGKRVREWVSRKHGYSASGQMWQSIYEKAL